MKRKTILLSVLMVIILGGMLWYFAVPEEEIIETDKVTKDSTHNAHPHSNSTH